MPLRDKFGLLVLAIISEGDNMLYNPPANTVLEEKSIIVVMGDVKNIQQARQYIS